MTQTQSPVLWRVDHGVGHIVLNRPEAANAIDAPFAQAFADAVSQAARADIGAVLLSSTGKQYCAGGDINAFLARGDHFAGLIDELLDILNPAVAQLAALPLPVISAVHGPVGGAGIAMALCADIVLAAHSMKLRGGYSAIGLSPDIGASYFLARRAGAARAKYILMTNRALAAEECLRLGLVDELHAAEALPSAARALATQLAGGATGALGGIKRLCDQACSTMLPAHLERERDALLRCAVSADGREGVAAFSQKRPPRFTDKRID
ncbi:enoyl-CoA hydratase/isomerase family protein [Bordetella petrii]|nr:enoyl-CoA hydratase/isomerase family protein [Bordetella petrii]